MSSSTSVNNEGSESDVVDNSSVPDSLVSPMKRKTIPPTDKKQKKTRLSSVNIDKDKMKEFQQKTKELQQKTIGKLIDRDVFFQPSVFHPHCGGTEKKRLPSEFMKSAIEVLLQDEKVFCRACCFATVEFV